MLDAFNSTLRYDLLNIDNIGFEQMVHRIYPAVLQLNKAHTSDTEAPFIDLILSISNGIVSTKIYHKRYDFDKVNFSFLDRDVHRRSSSVVIYLNIFDLQEHLLMLVISIAVTNS